MMTRAGVQRKKVLFWWLCTMLCFVAAQGVAAGDFREVKARGVLRHLGVPYAHFVTGSGDGLDVELLSLFAQSLGVRYEYVESTWTDLIGDLTGKAVKVTGESVEALHEVRIRGDVIASGMTVLPWRKKVVEFSKPTFTNQVWLIARSDSPLQPVQPSGRLEADIAAVKSLLKGHSLLGMLSTCLDPSLYRLQETGARITLFDGTLNELAPAIIKGEAELTLLDLPDALIALEKWPGEIKVIGPVSPLQDMAAAFSRSSPMLRQLFDHFLEQCHRNGTYERLVRKYYPAVFKYYPEFMGAATGD